MNEQWRSSALLDFRSTPTFIQMIRRAGCVCVCVWSWYILSIFPFETGDHRRLSLELDDDNNNDFILPLDHRVNI